jgi:hypothetical protein
MAIISLEFLIKDPLGLPHIGDIFSDTGSDESVPEPGKGLIDFAPACGRQVWLDGKRSRSSLTSSEINRLCNWDMI